jgi:hypothetical protein
MGVPVKTSGEKSWELVPASSSGPEGWGGTTEGVEGLKELEILLSASCFQLAACSVAPRLPSIMEEKRVEGDKGGKDIVKKLMMVVRSQEGLTLNCFIVD